jgi:hypothetical protein
MTYLLSALSIFILWGIGNKWNWIWYLGIISQILWFIFIYHNPSLNGLIPMHIVYLAIYIRNLIKWQN